MPWYGWLAVLLATVTLHDLLQRRHAILRNFPIIGHFRYWLESIGPELRQYIVTNNNEERPFSRDQRSWVYASSKKQNNYHGFGTDTDLENAPGYLIVRHSPFPLSTPHPGEASFDPKYTLPCAKVLGEWRDRKHAFRPNSVVNLSAMSFGSLSGPAVEAINRGCALAGSLHNTGEGGISPHHRKGGELIWQLGTGYFGARTPDGRFSLENLVANAASAPVRAIEIKLSQGAKPGQGGVLPGSKVTPEIAEIRGVTVGETVISPPGHRAFRSIPELLVFIERIAGATGLPVGIKSAVGQTRFWHELATAMKATKTGPDYIQIDGGEGGTGAAPLAFADHVALPFKLGFTTVHRIFQEHGMADHVVWIGSGRLGFPVESLFAMSLGCDMIAVAREAMLSIGCIQAQRCHTGHCPTGVATQNRWLVRGIDPTDKAGRLANYLMSLRKELLALSCACGVPHPGLVEPDTFAILDDQFGQRSANEVFGYDVQWRSLGESDSGRIREIMSERVTELSA